MNGSRVRLGPLRNGGATVALLTGVLLFFVVLAVRGVRAGG